ncbi:Pfs, NACHT and WD domain protein [Trichoderma sp. SZMC 28015]
MNIEANSFGDNATIHQGNVYHYSSEGASDRCLADLRSTDPRDDKVRIEQTKGGLLRELYNWILENDKFKLWYDDDDTQGQLLWITGDPGKGKTMLACGIIDELANQTRIKNPESKIMLSYFFCQGTDSRINSAVAVLRGLLYLIIHQQPPLISHIRSKYDIAGKSLFEDVNAWTALSQIFINVLQDTSIDSTILVIDALDECGADQAKLLDFILHHASLSRVKWIITSRNGPIIDQKLSTNSSRALLNLDLKDNEASISDAVDTYIKYSISRLELLQDDKALQGDLEKAMREKVNGTFLWVSLVMKELEQVESWDALQVIDEIPSDLKQVYARMLEQILQLKRGNHMHCMKLLSTACATYRPLSLSELGFLSDLPRGISEKPEAVRRVVTMCGSFLTIRDENVYLVHQSAKDYLSAEALQTIFPSGVEKIHHFLFSRSLHGMSQILKRDIWDLKAAGVLIDEIITPQSDPLATTRYSCVYWADHLCDGVSESGTQINDLDDEIIHEFLNNNYLYWLEALGLQRSISYGVTALNKLEALLQKMEKERLMQSAEIIRDARRFILTYRKMIEIAPLQLYASALLFSPTESLIRRLFSKEEPTWLASKPTMDAKWGPCIQTLEGHEDTIISVVCSADGQRLATASRDRTVKIWDYQTGGCLLTLKGHHKTVGSVAFSADCQKVVSSSSDGTVKIWDARVGNCLQTLRCQSYKWSWATLSPDGKLAATISETDDLIVWDLTGASSHILNVHIHGFLITAVFSVDNRQFALVYSNEVHIWDIATNTHFQTLQGRFVAADNTAVFSINGQQFASYVYEKEIKLWSIATGECVKVLPDSENAVAVAFSPDGLRIASALGDKTIKIWDTTTGNCLQTIHGLNHKPLSVAFSTDGRELASASVEGVARIWSLDTGHTSLIPDAPIRGIDQVIFSKDNTLIESISYGEVNIWNTLDGICSQTLPTEGTMFSEDGQRLAFIGEDYTIYITNEDLTRYIEIPKGYVEQLRDIAFTSDGRYFVTMGDEMIEIWEPTTGECLQTIHDTRPVVLMACSPDSQRIGIGVATMPWTHSAQLVKIWDLTTEECSQTLNTPNCSLIFFSPDGKLLGTVIKSYRYPDTRQQVKSWDVAKGVCLQTFQELEGNMKLCAFSPNNQLLVSYSTGMLDSITGSNKTLNMIKIWDAALGACLVTLDVGPPINSLSFDPLNNSRIHTNIGVMDLSFGSSEANSQISSRELVHHGYGISLDGMWIVNGKERLLLLPPDYRNKATAVRGSRVAIGVVTRESNRLFLMRFVNE